MTILPEDFIPLHSLEAEMSALGSMLFGEKYVDVVVAILDEEDLYQPAHREIFRAMQQLVREHRAIDLVTLKQELVRRGKLEDVGGEDYLIRLGEIVPSPANAAHYARIVVESATLRRLEEAGHQIAKITRDPEQTVDDKVNSAENLVLSVGSKRLKGGFLPMRELARDVMLDIDNIVETGEPTLGLPTGFYDLDELTTGLYGSEMTIVAARPSMGKTSLVLAIAMQVAARQGNVAFFSLEMGAKQLARRLVSMEAMISSGDMRKANLDNRTLERLTDACEKLYDLPLHIDETSDISAFEMLGKCRRLEKEHGGLELIVVDYLQLMRPNRKSDNRVNEVSDIARSLKGLAKELKVPVIALSQLSRTVETRDKKIPQLSDLRESGSIEAEADLVMFIYREQYYKDRENPEEANTDPDRVEAADIIIAKHRNGPTGSVKLGFMPSFARFVNLRR